MGRDDDHGQEKAAVVRLHAALETWLRRTTMVVGVEHRELLQGVARERVGGRSGRVVPGQDSA